MKWLGGHLRKIFGTKTVMVAFVFFILATVFSLVFITRATTPNPGHPWTDIGNGTFQVANTQTSLRTFTFPDMSSNVLTASATIGFAERTITTSSTLSTTTDEIVYVDASAAPITVTLPPATGTDTGLMYIIKKVDASLINQVTVTSTPGNSIDGIGSISFANRGEAAMIQSDGNQWRIVMRRDYDYDAFHTRGSSSTNQTQWYTSPNAGTALSTASLAANKIYAMPLILTKITTIDQMGVDVSTASGTTMEVGIYNDNGNEFPGSLAVDAGSQSPGSTGAKTYTANLPITLDAGLYWMVVDAGNAVTIHGFVTASVIPLLGYASIAATAVQAGWVSTQTAGALPATFPLTASATIQAAPFPTIFVHFAS